MGRPSDYTDEVALEIAARSAEGASLKTICESEGMPSLRTIFRWRTEHPEFDQALMRAHLCKADVLFEQSIAIADEDVSDNAQASRQRTRVQARQWCAARLNPSKYSERLGIGQAPGLPPIDPLDGLSERERNIEMARRLAFILARADHAMREQEEEQLHQTIPRLAYERSA